MLALIRHGRIKRSIEHLSVTKLLSQKTPSAPFSNSVDDMNKELEEVFGTRFSDMSDIPVPSTTREEAKKLTHVNDIGKAAMVEVSGKLPTPRKALASGRVLLGTEAFKLVSENAISKGDVLTVAQIAGINGAKLTSQLIPLCHNILLTGVDVKLSLHPPSQSVLIEATASTVGPTGVEMEAMTAVSVAALTVYDMCKGVTKGIIIDKVRLEKKSGGKSADWVRPTDSEIVQSEESFSADDLRNPDCWKSNLGHSR